MALVRCPDCGKRISDLAPACIGCGRPMAPGAGAAVEDDEPPAETREEMFARLRTEALERDRPRASDRSWVTWIAVGIVVSAAWSAFSPPSPPPADPYARALEQDHSTAAFLGRAAGAMFRGALAGGIAWLVLVRAFRRRS